MPVASGGIHAGQTHQLMQDLGHVQVRAGGVHPEAVAAAVHQQQRLDLAEAPLDGPEPDERLVELVEGPVDAELGPQAARSTL
jgi:ribulose 1,5-bisphosphate carboxylase large subunit-like protein